MHAYGTNSNERTMAIFKLFPAAATGTILGLWLLQQLGQAVDFSTPWWLQAMVGGPSASGALALVYAWVDRSGWRKNWVRWLLGIRLPDLNGRWLVTGQTSFVDPLANPGRSKSLPKRLLALGLGYQRHRRSPPNPDMTPWEAGAMISQTWSELSVFLEARFSSSVSHSGSIQVGQDGGHQSLLYEYLNTPKPGARQTMQIHRGLVRFIVKRESDGVVLDGEYYSHPRDRGNFGLMRLERTVHE